MSAPCRVVMIRHGESLWNRANKFTGWFDSDLSELGIVEAKTAGKVLKQNGYTFDIAFTSVLKRAIKTLYYVQDELDLHWIPVRRHWRLNERMYGGLQGLNKSETAAKHGEKQVQMWRRSYDTRPPPVDLISEHFPGKDPKYKHIDKQVIPRAESLKDTVARVLPYWYDAIVPEVKKGRKVLITAHGNSLRALVKHVDNRTEDEILAFDIPTGIPLIYEFDEDLTPIRHYYLANDEQVKAAEAKIAAQGKSPKET